jgi:uncharacterized protein
MDKAAGDEVGWQELTRSECFDLLAGATLGRIALVDDRGPIALPVNFVLDQHAIVFRTAEGTKLDAACRGSRVAFEVDAIDEAAGVSWSVLIRGEAADVTDPAELTRLSQLPLRPWAPGATNCYVRILPAVLTGRRICLAPPQVPHAGSERDAPRVADGDLG